MIDGVHAPDPLGASVATARGHPNRDVDGRPLRRDRHRGGTGGAAAGGAAHGRRHEGGAGRAGAVRRDVRQHRVHAHEDADRQRPGRAPGASRPGLRRRDRWRRHRGHGARQGARRRRGGRLARRPRGLVAQPAGLHGAARAGRLRIPHAGARGRRPAVGAAHLHQCGGTRLGAAHAGRGRGPASRQQLDPGARPRARAPGGGGRLVRRARVCAGVPALRGRGHHRRDAAALDRARRTRTSRPPSRRSCGARGSRCGRARSASASRRTSAAWSSASSARRGHPRWWARICCSPWGGAPTRTIWGSSARASPPTRAGSSPSTTRSPRTCPASGRWGTATGAAPSRTRRTTTSRSWRPTCSTARAGA